MTAPCRIAYAGCLHAGRRTSLAAVGGDSSAGASSTFDFHDGERRLGVTAGVVGPREAESEGDLPISHATMKVLEQDAAFVAAADAIIFVVDPIRGKLDASLAELDWCRSVLVAAGRQPQRVPLVFQLNKLDLPIDGSGAARYAPVIGYRGEMQLLVRAPLSVLRRTFSWPGCEYVETIADASIGVREAMRACCRLALPLKDHDRS